MDVPAPLRMNCPCGCGTFGALRRKIMRDGLRHVSRCPCQRCLAPRYKNRARGREHRIAAAVGGRRNLASGAYGGNDTVGGICTVEETANQHVCRGIRPSSGTKTVTRKLAGLYSDSSKPRALVLTDEKPWLVVQTYADFEWLCQIKRGAAP